MRIAARGGTSMALAAAVCLAAGPALAHATERAFVLLLPTGYYIVGGTAAVAASFLLLAFVPATAVKRVAAARLRLGTLPELSPTPTSLISFAILATFVLAGFFGSRDPLSNPLPLTVWIVFWVGITLLHPIFGNLWAYINPWTGPYRLLDRLTGGRLAAAPPVSYPKWLGYWPAVGFFFGFAWLELVHPAPDDPERLARAVIVYWVAAFAGIVLFGEGVWRERAEPFSIFFRLLSGISPFVFGARQGDTLWRKLQLAVPGAALLDRAPLPLSGVLFVLLTLSTVSFDGLSGTFWWLALGDINPLEFPGRTEVIHRNTIGLALTFAVLGSAFFAAIWIGWRLAGNATSARPALGTFIYSIMPISIAFHFSHYLTALLIEGQYAVLAASDPFSTGVDLLGVSGLQVTVSFLNTYEGTLSIWNAQTAGIVIGHVAAIILAHALAVRHFGDNRRAVVSQLPLAVLMVLYTWFGLWLLSTPVAM